MDRGQERPGKKQQAGRMTFLPAVCLILSVSSLLCGSFPLQAETANPVSYLAGAAEADITPRVASYEDRNGNSRFDRGDPSKPFGLGDPVLAFEEGQIRIGNGEGQARYIYDPIYAQALYLEDPAGGRKIAVVTVDLYMLMFSDVEAIRSLVDPSLDLDYILIAATHNHMGPDTLGVSGLQGLSTGGILSVLWKGKASSGINRDWFLRVRKTLAGLIEEAAGNKQPAILRLARTSFAFGLHDEREPLIIDTDMVVLAVDDPAGKPIATVVQWACHPEAVLLIADPRNKGKDRIQLTPEAKEAWGRTLSAGFPGYLCEEIRNQRGGVPLYINGALGGMITNLHDYVWDPEKHPAYPASTDPARVPEEIRIPNDFRFAPVQGREAARHALQALEEQGMQVHDVSIRIGRKVVMVPFENAFYRLVAALGLVGFEKRELYDKNGIRASGSRPCLRGCFLPTVKFPKGKDVQTEVAYLEIGPLGMATVPAELLPELSIGLPEDFSTNPERYFPRNAKAHKTGSDYRLQYPALKKQMKTPYKMVVCLAGDDLGYVIPESDFDPPHDLWIPPFAFWWFCNDSETDPHYEESATVSAEIEPRLLGALTEIISSQPPKPLKTP